MDFFELVKISTQHLELTNPATPEKLGMIGRYLGLDPGIRILDFGCGYGRTLEFWAEKFGVSGLGVEIHSYLCQRAQERIARAGLLERIDFVCENVLSYKFDPAVYDIAVCLGATFIWGGYTQALQQMAGSLKPGGRMVVGEPYYIHKDVPKKLVKYEGDLHTEYELLQITREEGYEIEFVVRASQGDWDRYMSASWSGLLRWVEGHPHHPERDYVLDYLHRNQDIYFRYQRQYEGWAIYVLNSE